jgi:sugar lactone lactonase YvrE
MSRLPIAVLIALSAACGEKRPPPAASTTASADTPATAAAAPTIVKGFDHPESAIYDAALDVWFVSSINGDPLAKDGNGFISRLRSDGSLDSLKFIASGVGGVTLNGPKGLAIVGDTLWVADIDAVRAFNAKTGAPVATVDLKGKAKFLNDAVAGPDGVYFTDSGLGGGMSHPGPDRIFRIAPDHSATIVLEGDTLAAPNGITWDKAAKRFIVVPMMGNSIRAWTPGQKNTQAVASGPGQFDGVELLGGSRILVSSWADSSLLVVEGGKMTPVISGLSSPAADFGIDTQRGQLALPLLMENRVEFRALPSAAGATQ